jgi:protein expanded
MLRDEVSRHNYYLQLKANTIQREVPKECNEQSLILLGGLALQAEVGDCPDEQNSDYIRAEEFLPANMRTTWGTAALYSCHKENRALSRADAETHFIKEACGMNETINTHLFRMKTSKNEMGVGSAMLSIFAKGLKVSVENSQPSTFLWPSISKLCFDKKKFEIRSGELKHTLYSGNDDKNKMLLALCRETHQFSMKIAPRLTEAIKREEEESHCMHACYMYSRALNLPYKSKSDQRISVISSTSSNTTSGIVSDRVHSEDELEILINTPPQIPLAAPSTESLALAHLLDCPSVSRQTSSVGQVSMQELNDTLAAISIRSNTLSNSSEGTETKERSNNDSDSSPPSQHNIGSQCSSTCSTVVVQTETINFSPIVARARTSSSATGRRQNSTCSSLELGYSHTAQNSTLSETPSINRLVYSDHANEDESNSGVYTLTHQAPPTETSGVYTMNSSEMTGESSEMAESETHESSHYGSFRPNSEMDNESVENLDSVDGEAYGSCETNAFRLRSDSNVSASGSFRGDGSDPTDSKHTLLSVEELTDLIVGRGTYPSRKTVSHTMDSDCDYVTLPLPLEGESYLQGSEDTAPTEDEYDDDDDELLPTPPAPPKRIDSNKGNNMLSSILEMHSGAAPPASPPPYNAHHETTGLRGPDVAPDIPEIPLRDPPPYPQKPQPRPAPAIPSSSNKVATSHITKPHTIPEEAAARFVTTRPQINILKAHTSIVGEAPKPSYAAPTVSSINSLAQQSMSGASTIGIPIVPYKLLNPRKSMPNIPPPPPPYLENKPQAPRTCVLLPVARQYPRPPPNHRQPPPVPPQLATVYTSQLARSQIELYQQQLYSDVDYVIYPLQDPSISQQEYLDSKQGSLIARMAQNPPPNPYLAYHTVRAHNRSWDACKNHTIYRSTPYLSMAYSSHSRYASTQNLSDTYVQLPGAYSPIYSPSVTSLCSGYDPPPPPPLRPRPMAAPSMFARSRSDDNILNSLDIVPRTRRLPPPPPPPYEIRRTLRKPPLPCPMPADTPPAGKLMKNLFEMSF